MRLPPRRTRLATTAPVGTPVLVWLDDGAMLSTKTTAPPRRLSSGQWTVQVAGTKGEYPLSRVFDEREALR